MAWNESIIEARYTSPSGSVFSFSYENLSKKTALKTALFLFPEKDGAYLQSLGRAGRTFPMNCIFYGSDCMDKASAFEAALEERGVGELQHPIYGTFKVVPTGELDRSDGLVSDANQSTVGVVFAETMLSNSVLSGTALNEDKIEEALDECLDASATEFDDLTSFDDVSELISEKSMLTSQVRAVGDKLSDVAKKSDKVYTKFVTLAKEIPDAIDDVAEDALGLGRKVLNYIATPSRIVTNITEKVKGYTELVEQLLGQYSKDPAKVANIRNQYASTKLCLYGALASMASGVATASLKTSSKEEGAAFSSRQQAVSFAAEIMEVFDAVQDFVDDKNSKDVFVDAGGGYSALLAVVRNSVDTVINSSFQLPIQRTLVLDRDRQVIELVAELYGNFDKLDEFIDENALTADELTVIPMGRKVIYYAEVA